MFLMGFRGLQACGVWTLGLRSFEGGGAKLGFLRFHSLFQFEIEATSPPLPSRSPSDSRHTQKHTRVLGFGV